MRKTKWHLIVLLCYSIRTGGMDYIFNRPYFRLPLEFIVLAQQFWVFYTGYALLYFLFMTSGRKKLNSIFILPISLFVTYLISLFYCFVYNKLNPPIDFAHKQVIFTTLQTAVQFFIPAVGYFFIVKFFKKQEKVKELEQQKLVLQKELLQSENNFLRAQINPHFLYNCLNFFYSETFQERPDIAEAIMLLSQMMRYSLTDFSATNGLANLHDEVEHIEHVIQLNKFRFSDRSPVLFEVEGDIDNKKIVPMLLMTLVENIFKHGDLKNKEEQAYIKCVVDESSRTVHFTTVNKRSPVTSVASHGLGISNIRQRLKLLYDNEYQLHTGDNGPLFEAKLTIPYFITDQIQPV